jgi:SAM-dependent methyltransferase
MQEPDDWRAVHRLGHRNFVGGNDQYWDLIGNLQFEFLKAQGLKPSHTFFDIGCGSLRAGTRLVEYLEPDRYFGIDKHIELLIYGVALELGIDAFRARRPRFLVTDTFEFGKLGAKADFAIAQSLFTHLNIGDISRCLTAFRPAAAAGCRFFATFFEVEARSEWQNPDQSHSHGYFEYTREQMESLGAAAGWAPRYIGTWNHPRYQRMMEFVAQ